MARREILNAILQSFQKLGGNVNDVLGTKTNISFLGKGKSPELMLDMDINTEVLGVLPQSKAVEELTSSVGYAVSNKLNDIQANKLLSNMQKMKDFYIPPAAPANITDMATRTRNLDKEGLMSLRMGDDLPPPGSRGGPDDIAAPVQSADETFRDMARAVDESQGLGQTGRGLESLKDVKNNELIMDQIVDTIYLNAGVSKAAQPAARGNAREFLNRVKDLEDPTFPGGPTLSSLMEADDFRFMTEGGGGGMGDPLLLVQKYFGPKVASAVARLDGPNDIQLFAERLVSVKDVKGRNITDRGFDPESVDIDDFEFADGGRVPMFMGGAARMGYQALRRYGFEAKDITRMFKELAVDKSLQGKEKTLYFQTLNKALKNPEEFPDTIKEMQLKLGIDVGTGFKNGGLAGILEV